MTEQHLVLNGLEHPTLQLLDVADSLQMCQVFSVEVVPQPPALVDDLAAPVEADKPLSSTSSNGQVSKKLFN